MMRSMRSLRMLGGLALSLTAFTAPASGQTLPPGPPIVITSVTQPLPTSQQYTLVDVPYLREIIPKRTNNRLTFKASSMAEMNLGGPEMIRLIRSGHTDIGAASLGLVAGDIPFVDGADLAGLNPTIEQARKVADAFVSPTNRELERFNTKIIAMYPFQAQIFWCKKTLSSLSDIKGRKVRTYGTSYPVLVSALGGDPISLTFP